jgi:hypothetical protein
VFCRKKLQSRLPVGFKQGKDKSQFLTGKFNANHFSTTVKTV